MPELTDPAAAYAATQNPATSPAELATIAQTHPNLRAFVAVHPNAYPGLLSWLASLGDPQLAQTVAARLAATPPAPAAAPAAAWSGPSPVATRPAFTAQPGPGLPVTPVKKRRLAPLLIAGVASVAVLAVVFVFVIWPMIQPTPKWNKVYGGTGYDSFSSVAVAADGTITATGQTYSTDGDLPPAEGYGDALVARINSDGTLAWAKTYGGTGGTGVAYFSSVAVAADGTITAAGGTSSTDGDLPPTKGRNDALIARINPDGTLAWAKTYGGTGGDAFFSVTVAADGTITAAGWTSSTDGDFPPAKGEDDALIARINPDGTLAWAKTYGGTGYDWFNGVAVAADGTITATGETSSTDGDLPPTKGSSDALIARINPDGTLAWAKTYGGTSSDYLDSVAVAADGTITATGWTSSTDGDLPPTKGEYDALIARINPDGTLAWAKTYGGTSNDRFSSVAVAADGTITAAGYTSSTDGDLPPAKGEGDALIVHLDADGNLYGR